MMNRFILASIFFTCMLIDLVKSQCAYNAGCDPRCSGQVCDVLWSSLNCCNGCVAYGINYYRQLDIDKTNPLAWTTSWSKRCSALCPAQQYQNTTTTCGLCDRNCTTCSGSLNTQCKSCAPDSYQLNATTCYNMAPHPYFNPCPNPYYGIDITKKCEACPTGCTVCNIYIEQLMPGSLYLTLKSMNNINCTGDVLCGYTLRCYSCNAALGYFLEEGFCFKDQCRKYQIYNSTAGSFDVSLCYCTDGYYKAGSTCSRCYFTCQTCSSNANTACNSCPIGYTLSAVGTGSCIKDTTTVSKQYWSTGVNYAATFTVTPVQATTTAVCGSYTWLFGYSTYTVTSMTINFPSVKLLYNATTFSNGGHYGVHFRATFLFIDQWKSTMSIIFRESSRDVYAYNYGMQQMKGEYMCGQNYHDHVTVVDFWFSHTSTNVNLQIEPSLAGYAWGIKDVLIEQLACHISCNTCSGPSATDCTSCKSANYEVLVNGDCVCDIVNGYYLDSNTCVLSCSNATYFKDNTTRSCTVNCSFPLMFKYSGKCYEQCPIAAPYRRWTDDYCMLDCFNATQPNDTMNLYKYDGKDKVCYNICPYGMFGDPQSKSCVSLCPATSSQADYVLYGAFSDGNFCTEVCSSGKFAFPGTRECLSSCPAGYYVNSKNYGNGKGIQYLCELTCSVTLGGDKLFGNNKTIPYSCVNICPQGTYADQATNLCVGYCNVTAYKQNDTTSGSIVGTCQTYCDTSLGLYGNNITHQCVLALDCPNNTYGDSHSSFCELLCTNAAQYGKNSSRTCQTSCGTGFKQNDTKTCVKTCPQKNNAGNPQFGDSVTDFCQDHCTGNYFSDNQTNRQCKATCATTPTYPLQTYGQNNKCVFNCSSTTWADPLHVNRRCVTSCTYGANKTYGYNQTRKCVATCPDTQFGQVISTIPLCVFVCQSNEFGYPEDNTCVANCPFPYYGDPNGNRTCVKECLLSGYYALNLSAQGTDNRVNRTCVQTCTFGWADNITRNCAMSPFDCSDGLYAHQTNHKCVLPIDCTGFADPVTRKCVPTCYVDATVRYFGDRDTHICKLICPSSPDYYGDNTTHQCQLTCSQTNEIRDPQNNRRCVTNNNCSRLPVVLFGDLAAGTCVTARNCTAGTFGDNNTMKCESDCQGTSSLFYADPVSKQCVNTCQLGYYAYNLTTNLSIGICSKTCPLPLWADNKTVRCTPQCSPLTYGVNRTDAVNTSYLYGTCQSECPLNQFARDIDNLCVSNCQADHWGQTVTRKCQVDPFDCPQGYYADNYTHMCVISTGCSLVGGVGGVQWVADNLTKQCLPACPPHSTIINWADMTKKLCVAQCPWNKFGDNNTLRCVDQCKTNSIFNGQYADPQLRICVVVCSAAPIPTYGQNTTYTCVQAKDCPANQWAQDRYYDRVCVSKCPDARINNTFDFMFSDSVSKKCVLQCPTYYYGNIVNQSNYGVCVSICPAFANGTLKFGDNSTQRCVKQCQIGTYGDQIKMMCVKKCPLGWYAQRAPLYLPLRYCVQTCDTNSWSQEIGRTCVEDPFDCPTINGYHWYALNLTTSCVQTCPQANGLWGQNDTYTCQPMCNAGSYKYNTTRVCIDLCPASLDDDGSFSDQGMCVVDCITPNYYRDPQNARSCQPQCSFSPVKYFADDTTMKCVLTCPSYPDYYYAYESDKTCRLDCPLNTMRDQKTRYCVSSCPTGNFFDENSDSCVAKCPSDYSINKIWYGDSTQTIPKCVEAPSCPSSYFADDNVQLCVQTCSSNQWKYNKFCVTYCPDGTYGNKVTGFCVIADDCPDNLYANNQSRLCVDICNGTFADVNNQVCVPVCPNNYFADSETRVCSLTCTNNSTISLHKNVQNKTCVSSCAQMLFLNPINNNCQSACNDPYYEDPTTQICVSVCPSVPPLYGQNDTNKCVQTCSNLTNQYKHQASRMCVISCPGALLKNNISRFCVSECYNNTYADTQYCVTNCTPKFSLQNPNICTSTCPNPYFKDPTTFKCVLNCPTDPLQYYQVVTATERKCDLTCPGGYFRDDLTYSCVNLCPPSPPTYADITTGNCTTICSSGYYAHQASRTCKSKCPGSMYADPLTRKCVDKCKNGTDTYGDNILAVPACVNLCSPGTFANPYTLKCEGVCGTSPKTYGFDNTTNRICLESCPYPYIADNQTHLCQIKCLNIQYPYLDKATKQCVSSCNSPMYQYSFLATGQTVEGQCVKFCPSGYFAYLSNNSCMAKCPDGFYGDTQNNTCYSNCTLSDIKYADSIVNLCVGTCSKYNSSYDTFADLYSRKCVSQCPNDKFTIKDNNTRRCQPRCTHLDEYADWTTGYCVSMCPIGLYADPVTLTCIQNCSLYSQRFIYESNRSCVANCNDLNLFQNSFTRTCVVSFQCEDGFWGLISTGVCVDQCPTTPDMYGDQITQTCVLTCPNQTTGSQNYYADFSTRQCVKVCPQIPALFARNDTRSCVLQCPFGTYADNYTRKCVSACSLTPGETFADNSTNRCVTTCPTQPNYFASNQTYQCVKLCTDTPKMYADYSTRTCVKNCPGGDIDTYAYETTRFCVKVCPGLTYMQNSTRTCESICKTGYADPITKFCIGVCPPYTYGHVASNGAKTCKTACPAQTPALYAQDGNNLCMTECLAEFKTYRDSTTSRCVKICPINQSMFADNSSSRICRTQCTANLYSDYSTRFCVSTCPTEPALFAILDTRVCTDKCPVNSWADNITRKCILDKCPSTPIDTYGDNSTWVCVKQCSTKPMTWADNSTRTCVAGCPSNPDYYADNNTRKCVYNCSQQTFADSTTRTCVQTCPDGWYGINSTRRCSRTCPIGQFADILLHLCVAKCSVNPIYYGNPDTQICVIQCPAVNNSFGNPLTQECVNYQVSGFSGCPNVYFADNFTRLCVAVCPFKTTTWSDTYGDNSTWKCVSVCPGGSQNTFSDNSTMRCVKKCPQFPQYYAQEYSRRCVSLCLQANSTYKGSFSDNSTRLCVQRCPSDPDYYSDNSTRRCVFYCPKYPLTFADYSTRRCVTTCPSDPDIYGDLSTGRCVDVCPEMQQTYADYSQRLCVRVCPTSPSLFGQNQTNRCVSPCPSGSFADNASRLCVAVCPQYPDNYGDPWNHLCVSICPSNPDSFADPISQQCVLRCPDGYYAQNSTRRCLPQCHQDKINYADNKTNKCVSKCPSTPSNFATYGDNTTKNCVLRCPAIPFTYADNTTRMCLTICQNITTGGYAQNETQVCVSECPEASYGDITSRYCVRYCPDGWYSHNESHMCLSACPSPYYADPTTQQCVDVCPVAQLLFGQPFGRTCIPLCPQSTYADFNTQTCVTRCPSKAQTQHEYDTFGFNDTNECLDECPIPLYGYPVTYVCVDICPDPYYQNITDHRCYKCPDECSSCNYPQACLTCVPDHFLYAGSCVQSCPTFPVITYANPNRQCGTSFQCTPGYFALNITKSCVQNCPSGHYKNNMQQTCDTCQRGCSTCTNTSYCIVCNNQTAIWYQFQCYTFCSPLRRFYTEGGCVNQCPQGTYLNLTTCTSCSSICKTCVVQPQNCITCADGLYLSNNLCVQKCPTNSKAVNQNGSLLCKSCSLVDCTVTPLTYEVSQFVDNFQYKFQLKFSEPVNITQQIQNIISIKKKTVGRLLATTFEYMDYTIIDYGNGLYEFILNDYDPSQGSGQFQFQISDPSAIVSPSGQLPQSTRTSVQIDSNSAYSLKDFIEGFSLYNTVLISLSMVLLVATFWTNYGIWTQMFDFMQIMFAVFLINVGLPPTPMYTLGVFKYSFFTFMPNFFSNILPTPQYSSKIMNSSVYSLIKDFTFLRTMGHLYFLLVIGVGLLLIIFICSKKFFFKKVKSWCKQMFKQKIWKKYLFQVVNILVLPIFLIGLLNLRSYKAQSTIIGFSIFSSWLFMISILVFTGFFAYKLRKLTTSSPITYLMLQKAYNFIYYQKIVLIDNENHYFVIQKNQVNLKNGREPRINQLRILPFDLQTRMGPMQISAPLFGIVYKILVALFVAAAYQNAIVQIFFFILINIAYGVYVIVKKPYIKIGWKEFTNEVILHNMIVVSVLLIIILILKIQMNTLSSSQKNLIGNVISIIVLYGITANFIYFLYRTYNFYFEKVWKPFITTNLFKDNYNVEYLQLSKKYAEKQELLKKQARPRSQFLQAIKVEKGEALAGMVLRDPNHTGGKSEFKQVKLRPNKNQIIKQDISDMFQSLHNEHQKSNKSVRSSQRLTKFQRTKVRNEIFKNVQPIKQQKYEQLKINDKQLQGVDNFSEETDNNQKRMLQHEVAHIDNDLISQSGSDDFEYEYIEEQYPENTPLEQIMKGCKKGDIEMH